MSAPARHSARYTPNLDGLFTDFPLGLYLERQTEHDPDRDFMVYPDRGLHFTYGEFNRRVDLLANGLREIGLVRGDHIGIWARNVPDWLTYFFAATKIGAVPVTINTYYKSHELAFVLSQSDMAALAMVDGYKGANYSYLDIVYELVPELRRHPRGDLKSAAFPHLKHVIYMGPEKHRGFHNTHELLALGAHVEHRRHTADRDVGADDVANMQYTSGTTGFPKGVMLTSRNILNNGRYIGERQKFIDNSFVNGHHPVEAERVCLPVPLFHCFGIVLGVMAVLTHGGTMVFQEVFDAEETMAAIEIGRATAVYGVPTMFISEMTHPKFKEFQARGAFQHLRTGIMAGSPCPSEWMAKCISEMNMREVTITYGLTEASPAFTMSSADDPPEKKVSTVGRKMPHCEVMVMNPETGEECALDEPGEMCCRGYNIMKGYYNMPEETARVIDANGWLHSGDLGTLDAEGYYRITGRLKDLIIRGGENISPREVEEFLYQMPGVRDVQVVGAPSEKYGEEVAAFIIPTVPDGLTSEGVREYARARISPYKVPKYVWFVSEFPLTASGKVQKYRLREMAAERLKADGKG